MNSTGYTSDILYGPASEPIDIPSFIRGAQSVLSQRASLDSSPSNPDDTMAELCRQVHQGSIVADLRQELENVYNKPAASAHLRKHRDYATMSIYTVATGAKGRKKVPPPKEDSDPVAVTLRQNMENIGLSAYRRPISEQVLFMRNTKYTDQNTLSKIMKTPSCDPGYGVLTDEPQALLTISILNKPQWATSGVTTRASQHVFLSSQTLSVLCQTLLCPSSNYKESRLEETLDEHSGETGFLVNIDDIVYGDGYEGDFADKLLQHLSSVKNAERSNAVSKSPTSLSETSFSRLRLRTGCPYWMMHRGNCEHFFVVDQIRLQHSSDPRSGYPITIQITPPLTDLCRACYKIPAAVSVNGDVRLGESPCLLCSPCWKLMGDSDAPGVKVLEIPLWPE